MEKFGVYNSLDAESTSIAIRVNIEDNSIQVIDNGIGIAKCDFYLLGQKHTTSKCVDLNSLNSAPNKYGFRGQFLSCIIEVSKSVKITSRYANTEETWLKTFYKRKIQNLSETAQRPSKGTTVDISGFLYNFNIQRKAINPLHEIYNIKSFLQQLSLVHNNLSLSLRDDSKNEIVFKLHKNRDIYQCLTSLFAVDKEDVQELKVEKNQYKVSAIIAKKDKKIKNQCHWIYLNGKFVNNTKLYKTVDDNLKKNLKLKFQPSRKSKTMICDDENRITETKIPFYLIFISCPYIDYDMNYTPKHSVLEFKNWQKINNLLEKLVKLYVGDMKLKEITSINKVQVENIGKEESTREQVKKIMNKILGNSSKKPGVSQMQNGIKGKLIKRKSKKQTLQIALAKIIPPKYNTNEKIADHKLLDENVPLMLNNTSNAQNNKRTPTYSVEPDLNKNAYEDATKSKDIIPKVIKKSKNTTKTATKKVTEFVKLNPLKVSHLRKMGHLTREQKSVGVQVKKSKVTDPLVCIFKRENGALKNRCNMLAKKVEDLMTFKNKRKRKVFINETVQYSNVIRNNKNVSIRKKMGKIVIHDFIPLPPKFGPYSTDNRILNGLQKKYCKSSYDLVHTILKTQQNFQSLDKHDTHKIGVSCDKIHQKCKDKNLHNQHHNFESNYYDIESGNAHGIKNNNLLPTLTFESHHYNKNEIAQPQPTSKLQNYETQSKNYQFITKKSINNFNIPKGLLSDKKMKSVHKIKRLVFRKPYQHKKSINRNILASSIPIEFSDSEKDSIVPKNNENRPVKQNITSFDKANDYYQHGIHTIDNVNESKEAQNSIFGSTYTVISNSYHVADINNFNHPSVTEYGSHKTYCIQEYDDSHYYDQAKNITYDYEEHLDGINNTNNITPDTLLPRSSTTLQQIMTSKELDPLNVCETMLICQSDDEVVLSNNETLNDSLFNEFNFESFTCNRNVYIYTQQTSCQMMESNNNLQNISHHFHESPNRKRQQHQTALIIPEVVTTDINHKNRKLIVATSEMNQRRNNKETSTEINSDFDVNEFHFKNRLRFVPKGLSPIFHNCKTKTTCDYEFNEDYYEDRIYNNFANDVQTNAEIFELRIQNVKELDTKDIEKVNNKLSKDNSSLKFNGVCLKQAKVMGQIDLKFIAAKIKDKCETSGEVSEFLVLFDQHAVHERICLERNLAYYVLNDQWTSVTLDYISLKLTRDDILYLHNYKDKFTQFGLQWTILNSSEVKITAIPAAILGKNPRQADVVVKAVRNLILEEITAIRSQRGCVSLYPQSIMDLVLSESCRYAIKFGDRLSKRDCIDMINSLSECKTPFQCAHGRPVLAVLMDIKSSKPNYKVDKPRIDKFVKCLKK